MFTPHAVLGAPRVLAAGTLLVLSPSPGGAQSDSTRRDTVVLAPIEVISTILPVAGPTIGSGIPARVSVVGRRAIETWEPRTLADALVTQPGVSLYDDLGSPYKLNITSRGFNAGPVVGLPAGLSVFLDGIRQNEADAAQVNFDLLPLEHVKRVELLSGSGSLLGPNSLGGGINLITRRGEGLFEAELEVAGGSFDAYSVEGSAAGTRGAWEYYVGAGYESAGGWRRATAAESYNAFVNVGRLGTARGVRLQLVGADSYAETAGSLPESVFGVSPRTNFTDGDFEDLDLLQLGLWAYAPVGPGRGSVTLYHRRHHAERFNVNQPPDPDVRGFSRNRTVGANLDWRWAGTAAPVALRLGVDAAVHRVNICLLEEDPSGPAGATLTTDVDSPSRDLAAYAALEYRLPRVTLSAGLRYDEVRIPFEDNLDPAADTSSTFRRLSPRGGASVVLGSGVTAYGSVGRSFRAPAVLELACADETAACPLPFALGDDPPLDPVVGTTYEMGGRATLGLAQVSVALYRTDVRDDIAFIQSDSAVFEGYFANIGATRREGVELAVDLAMPGGHAGYVNYAWTRATYRTAADIFSLRADADFAASPLAGPNAVAAGDRLPLVPEHQVRAGLSLALGAGLDAGMDARYTGRQWLRGDEANETRPLASYATADVRLAWGRGGWGVTALATNLLDSARPVFGTFNENRQTGELERFLTPMHARTVRFVVRRSFGSS
ncbi:MAG: TonB-dependent receptor [Gemmatimonadales bacterium]